MKRLYLNHRGYRWDFWPVHAPEYLRAYATRVFRPSNVLSREMLHFKVSLSDINRGLLESAQRHAQHAHSNRHVLFSLQPDAVIESVDKIPWAIHEIEDDDAYQLALNAFTDAARFAL